MLQLPQFPIFKKLEFFHKIAIERITHAFPPYSDFNFTSLWVWDVESQRMVSELNGNLVVRFTDYGTSEPFISIIGIERITESVHTLIEYSLSNGLPASLLLMPKSTVDQILSPAIAICEDRNNHDYIYEIQHLATFKGNKLESSR